MKYQELSNARGEKQIEIMKELETTGECFLCPDTISRISKKYEGVATPIIYEDGDIFVKKNDFPYEGTKLHLLVVPKRHLTRIEEFTQEEFAKLKEVFAWINATYEVKGASLFMRYGEMTYTGASLSHLHFHVLHGEPSSKKSEAIRVKLGYK